MDLDPYLDALRGDLAKATALADDHTRSVAERLLAALEPALRLRLVETLTDAAASLSAELGDVVEVRMDGRDPVWWVQHHRSADAEEPTLALPEGDTDGTARITLRLPESVKTRADSAADAAGLSLNTWIVNAVRAHLTGVAGRGPGVRTDRRITGWA
ncbi:toxin-antitoxin system HicB family antitoxin [Tessaracoccus sp. G1721]